MDSSAAPFQTRVVETDATGVFEEFLYTPTAIDQAEVAIIAPHGGGVEPLTDTVALQIAEQIPSVVCWGCRGVAHGNAFEKWHTTSHEIPVAEDSLAAPVTAASFDLVVSIHGLATRDTVLIGGTAPDRMVQTMVDGLAAVPCGAERAGDGPHGGTHPENIGNRIGPDRYLQVEVPISVLKQQHEAIVSGVVDVLTHRLSPDPEPKPDS